MYTLRRRTRMCINSNTIAHSPWHGILCSKVNALYMLQQTYIFQVTYNNAFKSIHSYPTYMRCHGFTNPKHVIILCCKQKAFWHLKNVPCEVHQCKESCRFIMWDHQCYWCTKHHSTIWYETFCVQNHSELWSQ